MKELRTLILTPQDIIRLAKDAGLISGEVTIEFEDVRLLKDSGLKLASRIGQAAPFKTGGPSGNKYEGIVISYETEIEAPSEDREQGRLIIDG